MQSAALEIGLILVLIVVNGVFSMSEIAVVSARKARLQQWADEGNLDARKALKLANSPDRFLATVQIGITLVGILAGAFGGATLSEKLAQPLRSIPLLAPYSQTLALFIVVLCITYLSLVIGELVPKQIGLTFAERVATTIAGPMNTLSKVASPIVHLLSTSTNAMIRLLGIQGSDNAPITEQEIEVLIQQGTRAGMFEQAEQEMIGRIFDLDDLRISALMTPRRQVVWLDLDLSLEENLARINTSPYSRFPVSRSSLDQVLGVVKVKELFTSTIDGQPLDIAASLQQPLIIYEGTRVLKVLETFKQSDVHIALIVDEYGTIQGLVTLNDILEAIVGDLPSTDGDAEASVIRREDGSWLIDGLLPINELKELLEIKELPGESEFQYQSLGGFVIHQLGRIPKSSEHFEWNNLRFEIVDMDNSRVDKVLVESIPTPPAEDSMDSN